MEVEVIDLIGWLAEASDWSHRTECSWSGVWKETILLSASVSLSLECHCCVCECSAKSVLVKLKNTMRFQHCNTIGPIRFSLRSIPS